MIIGLKSDKSTQLLLKELGIPILQKYSFDRVQDQKFDRYMDILYDDVSFKVNS